MSEIPVPQDVYNDPHADEHVFGAHDHHVPDDMVFVKVFFLLVVVTAIEVAWAYLPFGDSRIATAAYWGGLLVMMTVKFIIIAGTFMHLRFDNKLLTRVFYAGVVLAVVVYTITLCTFQLFSNKPPGFTP